MTRVGLLSALGASIFAIFILLQHYVLPAAYFSFSKVSFSRGSYHSVQEKATFLLGVGRADITG